MISGKPPAPDPMSSACPSAWKRWMICWPTLIRGCLRRAKNKMNTPQSLLEQGFQHHQAGRMKEAEDFYRRALKADPNHPDGLHLLGIVVNADGRTDEAMPLLERAVKANPGNAEFFNNLGQIYKSVGRIDDAINAYQGAIAADPNFSDAH
ncbi:MAG TPA: tetratricopeptide repeat protein, partial [Rhodospirillales bacterium]|nr:tetratricopeptide repeat protein [Rhodospirillales bacterium]